MQPGVEGIVHRENGPRYVREGQFNGTRVEVVTAYDITFDAWPFHVHLQHGDGTQTPLTKMPTIDRGRSMEDAFSKGMHIAVEHLARPTGFPTQVLSAPRAR